MSGSSIQALLQALKQKEGSNSSIEEPDDDQMEAELPDAGDDSDDGKLPEADESSDSDMIVDSLRTDYPKTYAKICSNLGIDPEGEDAAPETDTADKGKMPDLAALSGSME